MERRVIIVCCFVGFLGLLSAATGFAAEAKRIKASQLIRTPSGCKSPRSPAFVLGLTAAVSLLIAQIILHVCIWNIRHQTSTSNWFFGFSWFTFSVAFLLLLSCAALNQELMNQYCFSVKPGLFAGAAFLSHISVALGIFCYLNLTQTPRGASAFPTQGGVVMGHPLGDIAMGYPQGPSRTVVT